MRIASSSHIATGLCKWHTSSPPSPPRRRPSRQVMARRCDKHTITSLHILPGPVDDRMQTDCNRHGKHDCRCEEDVYEMPSQSHRQKLSDVTTNKINLDLSKKEMEEVLTVLRVRVGESDATENLSSQTDKDKVTGKGDLLLSAILRSSHSSSFKRKMEQDQNMNCYKFSPSITNSDSKPSNDTSGYSKKPLPFFDLSQSVKNKEKKGVSSSPIIKLQTSEKLDNKLKSLCLCKPPESNVTSIKSNNNLCNLEEKNVAALEKSEGPICAVVDCFRTKQCLQKATSIKCQQDVNQYFVEEFSNLDLNKRVETSTGREVPSALDKAKFRRSLDSAASMVFHWRTGLPLTSSPAPLRRASQRFDFDSTINSVSAIRSVSEQWHWGTTRIVIATFRFVCPTVFCAFHTIKDLCEDFALFDSESGEDTESEGSGKSPCSPQIDIPTKTEPWAVHYQSPSSALLGSFEESVLNGRLEPVSTVHGFTADLGASGSFCPAHLALPVTVFFYTLGDNDKVSTPYLAHINLGKKGYVVPRCGTIQVTLLNPLGTVIKMFVVVYDLTDIPNNCHTFLRQRTLYMPAGITEPRDNSQKYLRYLIHLR
ncbi:hypothetical protein J6590_053782 [Homalodisca vitripennis]|nr:hypothetical protein J6590_053782 [Homalodisca vitripennis]